MPKFKEFVDNKYEIPMINKEVSKKLNLKTNRMKNSKKTRYLGTDINPSERSFKNIPKYATGKNKVRFQDWLLIKGEGGGEKDGVPTPNFYGKSEALNAWVGWSHRAVYAFKPGDKVIGDNLGKKVEYPKLPDGTLDFDNGKFEPDFTIKDDAHAKQVAITFADNVS